MAGPLELAQDATVDVARVTAGTTLTHRVAAGRGGYLHVIDGEVVAGLDGSAATLRTGDALALTEAVGEPRRLTVGAAADSELILVDVPLRWEPVGIWRGRV